MSDEPREFPEVPLGGVTELRIHGVSGTPVESMLGDPHPMQVWGDGTAGFYRRPADGNDGTDHLEAYSWGGLTAGASARAAWLLLLPFMLVNVASWAHPARRDRRSNTVGTMSSVLRVLALTLTLTFVLSIAILTMDVLAWQCGDAAAGCGSKHWYTRWMTDFGPGVRVVVGSLVPLAFVGLIWKLSKSTTEKYENVPPDVGTDDVLPDLGRTPPLGVRDMARRKFWQGGNPVTRLRGMHVAASLALVAVLVAHAAAFGDRDTSWLGGAIAALGTALVLLVAGGLATPLAGRRRELFEGQPPPGWYCRSVVLAPWVAAVLLGAAFAYALWPAAPDSGGELPGSHGAKQLLVLAQAVLLVVLLAANVAGHLGRDKATPDAAHPPLLAGQLATFLAALACALAGAFAAGLTWRVADYLGCPVECTTGEVAFDLPIAYTVSGRAFGACVGLAVLVALWFAVRRMFVARPAPAYLADVVAEYPGQTDAGRQRAIGRIHESAALTDKAANVVAAVVLGGIVLAGLLSLWDDRITRRLARDPGADLPFYDDVVHQSVVILSSVGTWLVGAFALGLVVLGRTAYRNPATRRTVGILWDLGTFWPRAVHPFAPPCYCERTIPELSRRIEQLTDAGGRVVVSAHSQGTVIAYAALLQLSERRDVLALVTYGSPLHRLYARAFPHFFGLPVLRWGRDLLDERWINLYRRSDPIGGPVTCHDRDVPLDAVRPDRRLPDPAFAMPDYAFDWPVARGHSNYFHDPAFGATVAALTAEMEGTAVSAEDAEDAGPPRRVAKRVPAG